MRNKTPYWALSAGPLVTLSVGSGITSDINIFKLLILAIYSGFSLGAIFIEVMKNPVILKSWIFIVNYFFIFALLIPIFFSNSPKAQQFFGIYGRNLGFLHYFFLTIILVGISRLDFRIFFPQFLKSIIGVGALESIYAVIQFSGLDPIPWKKTNEWVFGTFGNPNYLSSFLAFSVVTTTYFVLQNPRKKFKLLYGILGLLQFGTIFLTASTQGFILVLVGLCSLIVYQSFIYSKFLGWAFLSISSLVAIAGLFGVFQTGPLASFLYQKSISFRGDYWRAGLKMFQANWIHGVGLDSYGDYYRMYRDSTAAHRRGLEIFSNSAHNLLIDFAASGGIFLLCAYIALSTVVLIKITSVFKDSERLTLQFKLLTILWVLFQLQSLISINIPSLAIWGWIFSGLIFSYERDSHLPINFRQERSRQIRRRQLGIKLSYATFFILIMLPLIIRDIEFKAALAKNNIPKIAISIARFPRDSNQIASVAVAFERLGRGKEALALARLAVKENPNSSRAWQIIYTSDNSDLDEKTRAKIALMKLDPYYAETLR